MNIFTMCWDYIGTGKSTHYPDLERHNESYRQTDKTHNPFEEIYWVSCLMENITSSSYGEGLEMGREQSQIPRQSFTRQIFFKILKSGCEIEELQLESYVRIANCLTLYMIVAWRILYLTRLGRSCPDLSCDYVFDEKEWQSVYAITQRKKPPKEAPRLNDMIRMIASLGGYLGRKHDAEPGPQVMWLGIQRMRDFTLAWEVFPGVIK